MLESQDQMSLRTRKQCFRGLVEICGKYDVLPNSYIVPKPKVQKQGDSPLSYDGSSEVWPGMYEEDTSVTVKSVPHYKSHDAQEIKKVGHFGLSSTRSSLTICRVFSEKS